MRAILLFLSLALFLIACGGDQPIRHYEPKKEGPKQIVKDSATLAFESDTKTIADLRCSCMDTMAIDRSIIYLDSLQKIDPTKVFEAGLARIEKEVYGPMQECISGNPQIVKIENQYYKSGDAAVQKFEEATDAIMRNQCENALGGLVLIKKYLHAHAPKEDE